MRKLLALPKNQYKLQQRDLLVTEVMSDVVDLQVADQVMVMDTWFPASDLAAFIYGEEIEV